MAPSNSLYIIQSEISLLSTTLKCDVRFNRIYQDEIKNPVYKSFLQLKCILDSISALDEIEPLVYLTPFLEVIRSENVTGPITGLALTSVEKFLSYGVLELPDPSSAELPSSGPGSLTSVTVAAEAIAESATQARFVATDRGSDEVVLMKVLQLLRTLLLVPVGCLISDRMIREILQSCFRICFEPKLSELLRRTAEMCLTSIVQLFFSRLPSLIRSAGQRIDTPGPSGCTNTERNALSSSSYEKSKQLHTEPVVQDTPADVTTDMDQDAAGEGQNEPLDSSSPREDPVPDPKDAVPSQHPQRSTQPYDVHTIHDLLHYLAGLLTPEHNPDAIISVSLGLVTIALETGADAISTCPSLLRMVQGDLTKHLLSLLYSDRLWLFAAALRVCFILFVSMRQHLKLQLEIFMQRLTAICSPDNESTSYGRREMALELINRLFLVPGFATELYVNYDCDPYCSNLFEETTKTLAKNAFPVDKLMGTHLLALDALLTVLNMIGSRCVGVSGTEEQAARDAAVTPDFLVGADASVGKMRPKRKPGPDTVALSRDELNAAKERKKVLIIGSEQFNANPKQGIAFLQEHGVLQSPLDSDEVARFLHENPRLDKRTMGEYLSNRKNESVLAAYVRQFNFVGTSISEALRLYLETFRLPGEAPLIERLMTHFAAHWYHANDAPFADVDAAFTLAYAILMLNTDQHNPNSKKQNTPMTVGAFQKNLSGTNGNGDFDPKLLEAIFVDIQKHEIVMPCEQTGLVRENYLWKCLLRRSSNVTFIHTQTGDLDADLFELVWGPTVSALSFIFDKTLDPSILSKVIQGFIRSAAIAAHHGMCDVLDNLVISLCKFTTLLTTVETSIPLPFSIGRNAKSRLALRLVFLMISTHGDILRYGWHSLLDCLLQLFRYGMLPAELVEVEDFLVESRRVRVTIDGCFPVVDRSKKKSMQAQKDAGVLSTFYQYITSAGSWSDSAGEEACANENSPEDGEHSVPCSPARSLSSKPGLDSHQRIQDQLRPDNWLQALQSVQLDDESAARLTLETIEQCDIVQLIRDTKFLVDASLTEFIRALLRTIRGHPCAADTSSTVSYFEQLDSSSSELGRSSSSQQILLDHKSRSSAPPPRRSMTMPPNSHHTSTTTTGSYYSNFCSNGTIPRDECRIVCLELLVRILLHNRDRIYHLWPLVQSYLADLLLSAAEPTPLIERVIVAFMRLAIHLLRRYEMTSQIFACLHYILLTRGDQLLFLSRCEPVGSTRSHRAENCNSVGLQVIAGLNQLLHEHVTDLPDPATDWQMIFNLLEVCGAGLRAQQDASADRKRRSPHFSSLHNLALDPSKPSSTTGDFDRDYTSDTDASPSPACRSQYPTTSGQPEARSLTRQMSDRQSDASWVVIGPHENPATHISKLIESECAERMVERTDLVSPRVLGLNVTIGVRDATTLKQALGCLDFLIRDPAHISPDNFEYCVRVLRVFVEACLLLPTRQSPRNGSPTTGCKQTRISKRSPKQNAVEESTLEELESHSGHSSNTTDHPLSKCAIDFALRHATGSLAIQLLDLIGILFKRATLIYTEWTRTGSESRAGSTPTVGTDLMWSNCWCPLLQAIARLCCDCRREVRTDALAHLQRALLSPVLQPLSGQQWENCFQQILFPLLSGFLESITLETTTTPLPPDTSSPGYRHPRRSNVAQSGTEFADPRMRAIPLLTKVFLMHLRPLHELPSFHHLWVQILTYMERYMHASTSDSLTDAVRESLKNVLLVMYTGTQDTAPILRRDSLENTPEALLWNLTAHRLSSFLPTLLEQLFPRKTEVEQATVPAVETEDSSRGEDNEAVEASTSSTNPVPILVRPVVHDI